ncbi:FMN-linked oxidoreductase, partial [Lentinus brumalis]
VTEALHAKGFYIFLQLWALGRAARPELFNKEFPDHPYVSASPMALTERPNDVPRELTKDEIKEYVGWYPTAVQNKIMAGFDGVEANGAAGYLPDQFLQDVSTRIRLSAWSLYQDMRMKAAIPTLSYLVERLNARHPDLVYIDVIASGAIFSQGPEDPSVQFYINDIWAPRPTTGGYDRESGIQVAEETGQLIGCVRALSANPDLPFRLRISAGRADQHRAGASRLVASVNTNLASNR